MGGIRAIPWQPCSRCSRCSICSKCSSHGRSGPHKPCRCHHQAPSRCRRCLDGQPCHASRCRRCLACRPFRPPAVALRSMGRRLQPSASVLRVGRAGPLRTTSVLPSQTLRRSRARRTSTSACTTCTKTAVALGLQLDVRQLGRRKLWRSQPEHSVRARLRVPICCASPSGGPLHRPQLNSKFVF